MAVDKAFLEKRVGHISKSVLERILRGFDLVLGR